MKRFIEGENRFQSTLFPESLEDYIADDNPVRVIDAFVDGLDLKQLGFNRAEPSETGRPAYEPAVMLKIYVYGYLNRLTTTRVLEQAGHSNNWLPVVPNPDSQWACEFFEHAIVVKIRIQVASDLFNRIEQETNENKLRRIDA